MLPLSTITKITIALECIVSYHIYMLAQIEKLIIMKSILYSKIPYKNYMKVK